MEKINDSNEIFRLLDELCDKESKMNDEQLTHEFHKIYEKIPISLHINHRRSNDVIEKRAKKYCEDNNMKLEDYNGVLDFRLYKIPVKK